VDISLKCAKPEVNWRACAFTTSGFIGHRTYSSLSDVPAFQIWGRWTKTAVVIEDDRYCGETDRHTLKWFYICPMPCITLDRQNDIPWREALAVADVDW